MPYATAQDLKQDILSRAGEALSGSQYDTSAIDALNRVYRPLCAGASEFLPESVENWWWLRREGILTLLPVRIVGTVNVVQDSANITFSSAPPASTVGYRFRINTHPEVFRILTHTAAAAAAVLDSPYTGPSSTIAAYKLMKVTYPLDAQVGSLISPMAGFRGNTRIDGTSPERMDDLWPMASIQAGVPTHFSLEDTQTVRFNMGGRTDGQSMRIEYRYRPLVVDLTDSPASVPLVPLEYRHLLSEMALAYIYRDKNDARDQSVALSAKSGLQAMYAENKHRLSKMNDHTGHIYPRQTNIYQRGPIRTDSGLIIG